MSDDKIQKLRDGTWAAIWDCFYGKGLAPEYHRTAQRDLDELTEITRNLLEALIDFVEADECTCFGEPHPGDDCVYCNGRAALYHATSDEQYAPETNQADSTDTVQVTVSADGAREFDAQSKGTVGEVGQDKGA